MKRLILTSLCVLFAANLAWADWIDLPVKWSQLPAFENGYDYLSNHPGQITRADDFMCYDPAPIVAVRWWGSYSETSPRTEQPGFWKQMDISFHFSDGGQHPYSLPLNPYISLQTVLAQEIWSGIYDAAGEPVYEYNAYLVEPFNQEPGTEYFIDIDDPIEQTWGWHQAQYQQMDFHAMQTPNHVGPWVTGGEVDLAFELMIPEPATIALLGLGALSLLRRRKA